MSRTFFLALVVAMLVPAAQAQTPPTLSGPWGPYAEEAPPPKLETPEQRLTAVRRQQMRAVSAHYRSVEAVVLFEARDAVNPADDAEALARIGENLPRLFALRSPSTGKTGAKAAIWEEPELFAEHLAGFRTATGTLARAARAEDRDALASALGAVRYQCLACHFHYRRIEGRPGAEGRRGK